MEFWFLFRSSKQLKGEENPVVNDDDLVHPFKLVEEKDGGPSWIQMMDRSTPTMNYRAWWRDPEVQNLLLDDNLFS